LHKFYTGLFLAAALTLPAPMIFLTSLKRALHGVITIHAIFGIKGKQQVWLYTGTYVIIALRIFLLFHNTSTFLLANHDIYYKVRVIFNRQTVTFSRNYL
jgi:hypothetical protein